MVKNNPSITSVTLIAAIGKKRELGIGGELAWRLSGDLKHFKELTVGHPIVMGRKTFDSIGKPLSGRTNIVVTRDTAWSFPGVVVAHSLEKAFSYSHELGNSNLTNDKIFVIGGGEIYAQALPFATRLALTHIDAEEPRADIFFPPYETLFKEISRSETHEENGIRYAWAQHERP